MQKAKLPVETVNKVLSFLATLPYSQVAELISEIQKTAEVIAEESILSSENTTEEV